MAVQGLQPDRSISQLAMQVQDGRSSSRLVDLAMAIRKDVMKLGSTLLLLICIVMDIRLRLVISWVHVVRPER